MLRAYNTCFTPRRVYQELSIFITPASGCFLE